jgi:N-ethylmaleimide reductase
MELFTPWTLGSVKLKNRIVMSPMTRCRAIGNVANELMATYYRQRASAGLIVTEGTSPSPNGLGYARIPGIFSTKQVEGWRQVTEAVHGEGGRIFLQIMHVGRIAHPDNMPAGSEILAPSAVQAKGEMWTDGGGMQPHPAPREMTLDDIATARGEYVAGARNAVEAGFDGIELHGANGYLLEQFIHPDTNRRTDGYGGSIEKRCRFVLEVAEEVAGAIGKERTGIRLSPYGVFNDLTPYDDIDATYTWLAGQLDVLGIVYVHLVDHSSMGAPPVDPRTVARIREVFTGTLVLSGGYTGERAEADIASGRANLVAFGQAFLANPDLPQRILDGASLQEPDPDTFYTADEKGYTDYPTQEGQ